MRTILFMAGGAVVTFLALKAAPKTLTEKFPYANSYGVIPIYAGAGALLGFIISRKF